METQVKMIAKVVTRVLPLAAAVLSIGAPRAVDAKNLNKLDDGGRTRTDRGSPTEPNKRQRSGCRSSPPQPTADEARFPIG